MKKRIVSTLLMTLMLCLVIAFPASAETKTIILKIGNPKMTVNGQQREIDPGRATKPLIVNGRTLVPIRTIVEAMGGSIAWDAKLQEIVMAANNKNIRMHLNNLYAQTRANAATIWTDIKMDVPPKSINGRTMVPLRVVSEQLGAKINWNATTKTITITFNITNVSGGKFSGAWSTNQGIFVFKQSGTKVDSAFETDSIGKITGTVSGNTFSGRWFVDSADNGDIVLTISSDGKSFTGKYTYTEPTSKKKFSYDIKGQR